VRFRTPMWKPGEAPAMNRTVIEGDPKFSL